MKHEKIPKELYSLLSEEASVCDRILKGTDMWTDVDCTNIITAFKMIGAWINCEDYDESVESKTLDLNCNDGLEKVYEDGVWAVYAIHTCFDCGDICGDARRLIANCMDYYNSCKNDFGGEFYFNVNKGTGEMYHFHFESSLFMDSSRDIGIDKPVLDTMGATDGLVEFYRDLTKDNPYHFASIRYDGIHVDNDGCMFVEMDDKYNVMFANGEMLSEQWFDWICHFDGGFARVELNGKYNYIGTDGVLLSKHWFDSVTEFHNGFAIITIGMKWNIIGTDGKLLWDKPICEWFDYPLFTDSTVINVFDYMPFELIKKHMLCGHKTCATCTKDDTENQIDGGLS